MNEEEREMLQEKFKAIADEALALFERCNEVNREYAALNDEQLYCKLYSALDDAQELAYALSDYIGVATDADWRESNA